MRSDIRLVMPDIQELRRNGIDVGSLAVEDTAKSRILLARKRRRLAP
jgi:hypothetical protein